MTNNTMTMQNISKEKQTKKIESIEEYCDRKIAESGIENGYYGEIKEKLT